MNYFYSLALANPEPIPILLAILEDRYTFFSIYLVLTFCVFVNHVTYKFCKKQHRTNFLCTSLLYFITLLLVVLSHVFFGPFEISLFKDFLDLYKGAAFLIYIRELTLFLSCLLRLGLQVGSLRYLAIKTEKVLISKVEQMLERWHR